MSLCSAIILTTNFKDLHSLSYQGLEGKFFCVYFPAFEICFLAGNNGEITFPSIPLNIECQNDTPRWRHTAFPQLHDMLAHFVQLFDILLFSHLAI